jgi:hypothetical protein
MTPSSKKTTESADPRQTARKAIIDSVPKGIWDQNRVFMNEMNKLIESHRILSHPLIALMNKGTFNENAIRRFHLEFGYAFAQIFTDAVLQAMGTCKQLERRLGPKGKMASRFLLQLNMLDELGFEQPDGKSEGYIGSPNESHYVKFHETLSQLGVSHEQMLAYQASPFAMACRQSFESTYSDHVALTCVLACAESCFDVFAGPWAKNTEAKTKVKVEGGYHSIHVLDEAGHGIDDAHSEDMWFIFCQAVTPDRYAEMRSNVQLWVDTWAKFADSLLSE